ncbi:MAG: nuclear transport factor 2 family protein [Verrucomicrobiales bacterium]|nr:nuclear transport factor 2 family protein [Verrucomicrobiales bacterium]
MTPDEFITRYEQALASQEWEMVEPLIHENSSVTFSNGQIHRGKGAVEKAFRTNFDLIKEEEYAMSDLHWVLKNETFAICTFVYHWSGVINRKPASGSGRGTSSLVKEGEAWQLVAEHLGPNS